jgi:hypothetical protein
MDSSLHSANLTVDDMKNTVTTGQEVEARVEEEEHHIHLPNPSLWPLLLSAAILLAVIGLFFIPDAPWLTIVSVPLILVGILGWALEDPSAPQKVKYMTSPEIAGVLAKFQIGQVVLDKDGEDLGTVEARVGHYILVGHGGLSLKVFYVPPRLIEDEIRDNVVRLKVSVVDLLKRGLDHVPEDLYDEEPEFGIPQVKGVPMFARGPLSPAETGHYNYGPNFPGINTDAAGSYRPEEVRPQPQRYVGERRSLYNTRRSLPPRVVGAD